MISDSAKTCLLLQLLLLLLLLLLQLLDKICLFQMGSLLLLLMFGSALAAPDKSEKAQVREITVLLLILL